MTPTPPEVVPAQVDREAAACLTDFLQSGGAPKSVARIRDGALDRTRIVQAFARHRLATIEEAHSEIETLMIDQVAQWGNHPHWISVVDHLRTKLAAIRNLAPPPPPAVVGEGR